MFRHAFQDQCPERGDIGIDHRQHADIALAHQVEGIGQRCIGIDQRRAVPHGIAQARVDIGQQLRLWLAEAVQDKFRLPVKCAGTARKNVAAALLPAQFGVSDRAADRIRIRVSVANDKNSLRLAHVPSLSR